MIEARVTGINRGGLSLDVNGMRGFMPISQIDLYRVENPEQFVNQRLRCVVTRADPAGGSVIVSRRVLLEKDRDRLWEELAEGQVRSGVVRSVRSFGAFVDLGGVVGLVHLSAMSWGRVHDPARLVQPGQKVRVVVLKLDRMQGRVSLGMKQLVPSPWDTATLDYPANALVRGKVTRLANFGAFIELESGIEGLVHISELAPGRVAEVSEVVQPGQEVQVKVLQVDAAQRKISLSLRGVHGATAEVVGAF
jgi:small subunit ribosomal protein S1